MGKALRKLFDVPVGGVSPPVHTKLAGSGSVCPTAFGQSSFSLTVLKFAAPTALIASTILFAQSPLWPAGQVGVDGVGCEAVAGTVVPYGTEMMSRTPS